MAKATTDNHFISVSRAGELIARRKGHAPVVITNTERGLVVHPPADAALHGVPASFRVMFVPGGKNREMKVMEIVFGERRMAPGAFQIEFVISDQQLGQWMRAAIDAALDAANP